MPVDHPHLHHPALDRFAAVAERFCGLVERHADYEPDEFLQRIHHLLPRLYALGIDLPHTDVLFSDDEDEDADTDDGADDPAHPIPERVPDPDRRTHGEWRLLFDALNERLGERCYYREVSDPFRQEEEVTGSLSDDIADIYGDLAAGLRKWRRGESGNALWEWRFGLESHWGEHAAGALRALHSLAAWHGLPWPSAPAADGGLPGPEAGHQTRIPRSDAVDGDADG